MTNQSTPPLTRDAAITTLIKNAETNLGELLVLNSALNCLSEMACHTIANYQTSADQLGCLIALYDQSLDRITNKMSEQLDQVASLRSDLI